MTDINRALRSLVNEVGGLSAFEAEVRAVISNTNWAVLQLRREEAEAALADADGDAQACTDCGGTGITLQTERRCACDPASEMEQVAIPVMAALAAAISLLERTPKAKKASPSDRMFDLMLDDYRKALEYARERVLGSGRNRADATPKSPSPQETGR